MTEVTIQLDARHKAIRSDDTWVIQKQTRDGVYDMVDHWTGNRRSLIHYLEDKKIFPTRAAEDAIAALPERKGFRE